MERHPKLKRKRVSKLRLRRLKLRRSSIIFSREIAKTFHDVKYYEAMGEDIKNLPLREKIKRALSTKRKEKVTDFIDRMKSQLENRSEGVFYKIYGIFMKNRWAASTGAKPPVHSNLLYLVSSVPMLIVAYQKIRKNKGSTTLGYILSDQKYKNLNAELKSYINRTSKLPDGMTKELLQTTSKLLRKGEYPWGASRRIWLPKPGQPPGGKMRPITIPPFMDRVIQASVSMVLQAIYEPWFERLNCSFGFRPNKGVHDAIYSITNPNTKGMTYALEGDIQSAYDKVCRKKLLNILSRKIVDRKFLKLIEQRLEYQYYDTKLQKYVEDKEGIPQGGIDSPYLWNIYMHEFDTILYDVTSRIFNESNQKMLKRRTDTRAHNRSPIRRKNEGRQQACRAILQVLNKHRNEYQTLDRCFKGKDKAKFNGAKTRGYKEILKQLDWIDTYENEYDTNLFKYKVAKLYARLKRQYIRLPAGIPGSKILRFFYVRYADDWILITNAPEIMVKQLKTLYTVILDRALSATLSEEKTIITNLKKGTAHFLGFEITTAGGRKIRKVRGANRVFKQNFTSGIHALPDRTRLLNRLHMKAYCDKRGFPREISFLSHLEPYVIVERYNAVLRGLVNYYYGFASYPATTLARWIYIIRFSCFKTLAQKYKTNIKGIFRKYSYRWPKGSTKRINTIQVTVNHKIGDKIYRKSWRLFGLKELISFAKQSERPKAVKDRYWAIHKGTLRLEEFSIYKKDSSTAITSDSFLDTIKWVNLRTQASLDAPCCICGSDEQVEMHHLRSVRKRRYSLIPKDEIWTRTMGIRNRKQIPVCRECHMQLIHKGNYGGTKLEHFCPTAMYDNRLVTIESHVHKGYQKDYTKTLEDKGWREVSKATLPDKQESDLA